MEKQLNPVGQNELLKHTATIHIANSLSILERKIYNILLKNAFNYLLKHNTYTVPLSHLKEMIGREGNNYEDIKEAITKLVQTSVQWNVFNKDNKNKWTVTTFLASAEIENGVCTYEYSSTLRTLLGTPNIYAKLNLLIQRDLKYKASIVLWEFLVEKLSIYNKQNLQTEYIKVDDIKLLFGIKDLYPDFKIFNRAVLKKAIEEINKVSDIEVEILFKRSQRRVIEISFNVQKKKNFQYPLIEFEKVSLEAKLKKSEIAEQDKIAEVLRLEFKFPIKTAIKLINSYPLEQILQSLDYVRTTIKSGTIIKNLSAYTFKAIEENWHTTIPGVKPDIDRMDSILNHYEENIIDKRWKKVWHLLKKTIDKPILVSWFTKLELTKIENNIVILTVRDGSNFKKDYIESHFSLKILKAWQELDDSIKLVKIEVAPCIVSLENLSL